MLAKQLGTKKTKHTAYVKLALMVAEEKVRQEGLPLKSLSTMGGTSSKRTTGTQRAPKKIASRMKRFDKEILLPFLGSSASQLAIRDGQTSTANPLEYLIKAKM